MSDREQDPTEETPTPDDASTGTVDIGTDEAALQRKANAQAFAHEMTAKVARGGRITIATILAILTVVGLLATTSAFWARSLIFEEDRWITTVRELPSDPEVAAALGDYLTEELFEVVDFEARVEEALPDEVSIIVPILTTTIEDFVTEKVTEFIESDRFQELWVSANRTAHQLLMRILEEQGTIPGLERTGDTVTLNLIPAINAILDTIGDTAGDVVGVDISTPDLTDEGTQESIRALSERLGVELPDDFGQITVYQGDRLPEARDTVVLVERIRFLAGVLTLLFGIGALWAAPNRRRASIGILLGSAAGFALLLLVPGGVRNAVTNFITVHQNQLAAQRVVEIMLGSYVTLYRRLLLTALFAAGILLLTGPSRPAISIRREIGRGVEWFGWTARVGDFVRSNFWWFRIGGPVVLALALLAVRRGTMMSIFVLFAFVVAWECILGLIRGTPDTEESSPDPTPAET